MLQKVCERGFCHVIAFSYSFEMRRIQISVPILFLNWSRANFWNAPFYLTDSENGIKSKTEKEPKMKFVDFGAFQKITKMLSRDKILLQMLFGAFHDTSCITFHHRATECTAFLDVSIIHEFKKMNTSFRVRDFKLNSSPVSEIIWGFWPELNRINTVLY